jgi:diketogulonate reductase-like aldo/keto reductase
MSFDKIGIETKVVLNNGVEMPVFGLGTYLSGSSKKTQDIVAHALEIGYRHIDTARFYGNERDIGEAIRKSGIPTTDTIGLWKLLRKAWKI